MMNLLAVFIQLVIHLFLFRLGDMAAVLGLIGAQFLRNFSVAVGIVGGLRGGQSAVLYDVIDALLLIFNTAAASDIIRVINNPFKRWLNVDKPSLQDGYNPPAVTGRFFADYKLVSLQSPYAQDAVPCVMPRVACHPKPAGRRLAHPTRFERATFGFGIQCSIQLSYGCLRK